MLCCKMCFSLMMAFGYKMGNNRHSDGMEEMKISDNPGACLVLKSMMFIKSYHVGFALSLFVACRILVSSNVSFFIISFYLIL